MRVVFLANTFPEDPVHLQVLADQLELTVYGTTFKLTSFTPPPGARTPRGEPTKVAQHIAQPPPGCRTRVFAPLVRIRRGPIFWVYPGLGRALSADAPDVIHVASEPWGALALQASSWCYRHPESALVIHGTDRTGWHGPPPERKGPLLFLDAARKIRDQHGVWTAIGGIGPLREEVERRARGAGVTYLSGLRFPEQVVALFRSLDVFVVPSRTMGRWDEQGPRAVIEAMMSSCLVVGRTAVPSRTC
jgi:glycosyltransferase involved in cell wall biosynthesis